MSAGSNPIENVRAAGSAIGRTWRATSVPVSTLMRAAMETAPAPRVVASGRTIVPPMVAGGVAGAAVRTRSIPFVGPPVMTGSPTRFSHVLVPSTIVANRA